MKNVVVGSIRSLSVYLALWVSIITAHTLLLWQYYGFSWDVALIDALTFELLFACFGIAIWFVVLYNRFDKRNLFNLAITHIAAAALLVGPWWLLSSAALKAIFVDNSEYLNFLVESWLWRIILGTLYYFIFVLVYYLAMYYYDLQQKLLQEAELKGMVKEAELDLLKFQINPHFIFNSLNSISSLTVVNPEKARAMIIRLSAFLRYAVSKREEQVVKFAEELENIDNYLDIEKTRFGDLLVIEKQIDNKCLNALLPILILQPLVENAIKHGVYEATNPILIAVKAHIEGNTLHISIFNSIDADVQPKEGAGMGLGSVQDRLFLLYGKNDLVTIVRDTKSFQVNLKVPQ